MILNDIKAKLREADNNVFYGAVDNEMRETVWDYTVFNRKVLKPSTNRTGYTDVFSVHIVRENFIPEGLEETVIELMLSIPGMKLSPNDGEYDYVTKPGTNTVVEMFSIDFMKPRKRD